jgi:2-iminobutanoate/2-iminopropanoate deaminase
VWSAPAGGRRCADRSRRAATVLVATPPTVAPFYHGPMNQEISPEGIAAPAANYAHAVLTTDADRWLHTSGVVPTAPDGTVPAGIEAQAEVMWANVAAMLADAEMGPQDVVSVTTYAVVGQDLSSVMAARDAFLEGRRAASTLVTVPALARPEWLVEVAIVAAR